MMVHGILPLDLRRGGPTPTQATIAMMFSLAGLTDSANANGVIAPSDAWALTRFAGNSNHRECRELICAAPESD